VGSPSAWQDHEWPERCGVAATYLGEIGKRELTVLASGDVEAFLREHDVFGAIRRSRSTWCLRAHRGKARSGTARSITSLHELRSGSAALGRELALRRGHCGTHWRS
jgi:uncharacterized protein CbrC (UPF0167 family)